MGPRHSRPRGYLASKSSMPARTWALHLAATEPATSCPRFAAMVPSCGVTTSTIALRQQLMIASEGGDQPITTREAAHNPKSAANSASRRLDVPYCSRTILRSRYSLRYERRQERSSTHESDCPKLFLGQRRLSSRLKASSAPLPAVLSYNLVRSSKPAARL